MDQLQVIRDLTGAMAACLGERETEGPNRSPFVDRINDDLGVPRGSPYCLSGLLWVFRGFCAERGLEFDLPLTASCRAFWSRSIASLKHDTPAAGDFVIWAHLNKAQGHAGYVREVLADGTFKTIEFNTSDSQAVVREGDGVYEKRRSPAGSRTMTVLGYVRVVDSIDSI